MSSPIVGMQGAAAITPRQKFEGHTRYVYGAIHLPGGQRIMTYSRDGSLRVWNLKSGKQIGDDWRDGESEVYTIALSPDGKKVASGGEDGGVRLWDIDAGKVIAKWLGHTERVSSVCWSRDGQRVLSGSFDGTVMEWDVEKGVTILAPIKTGHELAVFAAVYSPDMTMFATSGQERPWNNKDNKSPIRIWNSKTGELVATLKGHTAWVMCLAWTPDGKTLISGSSDSSIRTWSTTTWKQIAVLDEHTNGVYSIAISPNGRVLASASYDKTARLWNLEDNQSISSPLQHEHLVLSVSFSVDGKLLATACYDNNAYTWDVSAIVKEAGLEELLLDRRDQSLLAADATRRPVRQPIKVYNRVPQGFFDGTPHRAHSSARHDTPSRPSILNWARSLFSARSGSAEIELHEHRSPVVNVPYAKGKRRDASAREKRRPIPSKSKKPAASTSRPHNSNATQSSGAAQAQSSPQPQAAVSTLFTAPAPVTTCQPTDSHTNPHATIKHASRWTRFWLFFCCASPEYTHDHH